jgi:hypothetical protein
MGAGFSGEFKGLTGNLGAVPLLICDGAGHWRYGEGTLALSDVAMQVADVEKQERFALFPRGPA